MNHCSVLDPKEELRLQQMMAYEEKAYSQGYCLIAGIDEAGRGPLAGPVVAVACILPQGKMIARVNDSKKLSPKVRKELFHYLTTDPSIRYAIGIVEAPDIDRLNIYQATIQAMLQAIEQLIPPPDLLLIDGMGLPSSLPFYKIIKGDQLSLSIAAASIIAKETRDQLMQAYHQQWPIYGFDRHKGYGTVQHLEALQLYGPCPIHRQSFAPVQASNC